MKNLLLKPLILAFAAGLLASCASDIPTETSTTTTRQTTVTAPAPVPATQQTTTTTTRGY